MNSDFLFLTIFFLFFVLSGGAVAKIDLVDAVNCNVSLAERTEEQKIISADLGRVLRKNNVNVGSGCLGWTNMGEGGYWYIADARAGVLAVDLDEGRYIGTWKLRPFEDHLFLSAEYMAAAESLAAVYGDKFSPPSDPLSIVSREVIYIGGDYNKSQVGCLQNVPLRYSDISGEGNNELILFIGKNIVIFSISNNEVIFSSHYWVNDELESDEVDANFPGSPKEGDPAFIASSGTDVMVREKFPAWRSLSKLYFGDFDEDNSHDIVIWRKLFQSGMYGTETSGFQRIGERLIHYKLEDGRYYQQETPDFIVRGWLSEENLTWSDGFPDESECAGQQGEPIPEMHDPILNDPDLLH